MSFSTTNRNNTRSVQQNRRLVPPPRMNRPIPRPQMSRPIQPVRPPTGLPNQIQPPAGLPNQIQPPAGLPNQIQQPTGLPPTQTQMMNQQNSFFATPPQSPMVTGDAGVDNMIQSNNNIQQLQDQNFSQLDPAIQQQQIAAQQNFFNDANNTKNSNQYVTFDGKPANPMSQIPMMQQPPPGSFLSQPVDRPVAGPIAPNLTQPLYGLNPDGSQRTSQQLYEYNKANGLNPFANEPGRDGNGMLIPGYGDLPPGTFMGR